MRQTSDCVGNKAINGTYETQKSFEYACSFFERYQRDV